ncbi:hypothetical protein BH11CYA1_BH11CYA1_33720 [soil metagenome]
MLDAKSIQIEILRCQIGFLSRDRPLLFLTDCDSLPHLRPYFVVNDSATTEVYCGKVSTKNKGREP